MDVKQVYQLLNTMTQEHLGESVVVKEDLSNTVEIGKSFENSIGLDNYVRSLSDHIGRMVFVDRAYEGRGKILMRDGWEYGSILEKVDAALPEATENESWELQDGQSYDPHIFYKPTVTVQCWNQRVTYTIKMSFTRKQVKSSFSNATQMNAFFSMIYTKIANSMAVKNEALAMRTMNALIGETVHSDFGSNPISGGSGIKAVNLLYRYNNEVNTGTALTADKCLTNADFLRFASKVMKDYVVRLGSYSTLFNVQGKEKFTTADKMKMVMLSDFKHSADVYLYGGKDEFRSADYARLPDADIIPFWQGTGTGYSFSDVSDINIKTPSGDDVNVTGVLAFVFDRDAAAITNENPTTESEFTPGASFFTDFYMYDAGYLIDTAENAVVFFVA